MKKWRNQDVASILAVIALVFHFATWPIAPKCPALQTSLTLMESEKNPRKNQIDQTRARLNSYKLAIRILECAAFVIATVSVIFCYRSVKAREPGARVALCVMMIVILLVIRMK